MGKLNDVAVAIQYGLMLPMAFCTLSAVAAPWAGPQLGCVADRSRGYGGRHRLSDIAGHRRDALRQTGRDGDCGIPGGPGVLCDVPLLGTLHRQIAGQPASDCTGGGVLWLSGLGFLIGAAAAGT